MKNNIRLDENLIFEDKEKISKIATGDITIRLTDNNKSILEIGNIKIYNIKRFSWLQRKMLNVFFGFEVSNLEKEVSQIEKNNK